MSGADEDARLRAQLEHLRGDGRLREQAAAWAGASPEERLRVAYRLAREAAEMLERLPPDVRERALGWHEDPPPGSEPILLRLAGRAPSVR